MRCTKCHYLSFDPEPRCRNCGHDLSMDESQPLSWAETTLRGRGPATSSAPSASSAAAVMAPPRAAVAPSTAAIATAELPLFVRSMGEPVREDGPEIEEEDPVPLVKVPARPRVPVAVRRATPDSARLRAKYGMPPIPEPDLLDQVQLQEEVPLPLPPPAQVPMQWTREPAEERATAAADPESVGGLTRLAASAIDALFLVAIVGVVVYFTLRLTGLTLADYRLLPVVPMVTMFSLLAVGYLALFTAAGGQTLGKMVMHIRVVSSPSESDFGQTLTVSQAAVRSLAALPSVLVLGAGLIPALFGAGAAVHDRLAHTRVVHL